ncbi:hypothetical protein HanPSC8_Chr04g0174121 [Helianthus annuus]|nr:hypothetical protein HanPSC8_Chr04g0174121 [Helianthus annuus]
MLKQLVVSGYSGGAIQVGIRSYPLLVQIGGVLYVDIAGFEAWTYSRKCWYVGNIHIQMTGQFLQEVFAS